MQQPPQNQSCSPSFLGRSSCIGGPVTAHGRTRWETEIQSTMPGAQGVTKRTRRESQQGGPSQTGGSWVASGSAKAEDIG